MFTRALRALRAALAIPFLLSFVASPLQAAGTVAYSLSQQLDQFGNPLGGCLLYTVQAGTTSTPQNSYKDTALTLAQPNPLVCDAAGRLPQFFLADGLIKIRITDKFGVQQVVTDNILVIGPSSGGGGGGSIDPTTIAATGDLKAAYGTQVITGWVRLAGRTIGSASSGATERANADVQALFQYLWTADPNLAVSGGRGGSSIADWTANKQLTLPDGRGRVVSGLDDMGNSAAARYTGATFIAGNATTLGSAIGTASTAVAQANLPNVNFTVTDPGHTHGLAGLIGSGSANTINPTAGPDQVVQSFVSPSIAAALTGISVNSGGSGTALQTVTPSLLATLYIKL